ncbi:MAG: methyl-accepting chemotaxis protein [Syntrophotaleaceae bacterium]
MFENMTLKKKLTFGFSLVLVLLLAIGAVGFQALFGSTVGFQAYRGLARDTNLSGQVQANMLMVRMNVKDFLITGSDQDKQEFADYWQKVSGFMKDAQSEIQDPERAALIDDIDAKLADYEKGFQEVVALVTKRNRQVLGVLDMVGPQIEKNLTEILLSARQSGNMNAAYQTSLAMRNLLLARLYVVKFLESNEQSAIDRVGKEFAEMEKSLGVLQQELNSSENRRLLNEINGQMDSYAASFAEVTRLIQTRNQIVENRLDKLGPEIAAHVEEVKLDIKGEQDALGPKLQADNRRAEILILVISVFAILLGIGVATYITRNILGQMGGDPAYVIGVASQVAAGDLDLDLPKQGEKAESLYAAIRNMVNKLKEKAELAERIATGDLTTEISLASDKDALGKSLSAMVSNLNEILGQIQVAGEQIASGSSQISDGAQSLSQGATESAASVEEITASMTQLASQTRQNADNAGQANKLVNQAKSAAEQGNRQMQQMVSAMFEINEAGQNISKIIKVIDEIAFQTNLLALNAAVEAARAGQHGKGFAVVAEEVRNLAARSAQAAKETAELIEGSVQKTSNGTEIASNTEKALQEIVAGVIKATDLVSEIAAASQEQSEGFAQVNQGLGQIDQVTQQNTANAEESAAAAEELSSQAEQLRQMLSRFKIKGQNQAQQTSSTKARILAPGTPPAKKKDGGSSKPVIALDDNEFGRF